MNTISPDQKMSSAAAAYHHEQRQMKYDISSFSLKRRNPFGERETAQVNTPPPMASSPFGESDESTQPVYLTDMSRIQ